jgi:transcriptional regulator
VWVNPLFTADARQTVVELVRSQSLATLVVADPLRAAHLPLLVESYDESGIVLIGHIPKADPLSAAMSEGQRVLSIFHGPRAYVSAGWYGATPGLSTYNFTVAHLSGAAEVMTDSADLRAHLVDLIRVHEEQSTPPDGTPWQLDDVAHARIDQLLPLVLGFRIRVDEAQAKAKLGQNRTEEDRTSTAAHLGESPHSEHRDIAALMEQNEDGHEPRKAGH